MKLIDLDELNKYPIRLNNYDKENGNMNFVLGIESVLEWANYLPIIEAKSIIYGKWIETTVRGSYAICCSVCGSENEVITPSNFCPNCGAEMSLEIESDNNEN